MGKTCVAQEIAPPAPNCEQDWQSQIFNGLRSTGSPSDASVCIATHRMHNPVPLHHPCCTIPQVQRLICLCHPIPSYKQVYRHTAGTRSVLCCAVIELYCTAFRPGLYSPASKLTSAPNRHSVTAIRHPRRGC